MVGFLGDLYFLDKPPVFNETSVTLLKKLFCKNHMAESLENTGWGKNRFRVVSTQTTYSYIIIY